MPGRRVHISGHTLGLVAIATGVGLRVGAVPGSKAH